MKELSLNWGAYENWKVAKISEKVMKKSDTKAYARVLYISFFFRIRIRIWVYIIVYIQWLKQGSQHMGKGNMEANLKSKAHSSETLARGLSYAMKQCKVEEDNQAKIAVPWIDI